MSELAERSQAFDEAYDRSKVEPELRSPKNYHIVMLTEKDTKKHTGEYWAVPKQISGPKGACFNMRPNGAIYSETSFVHPKAELSNYVTVGDAAEVDRDSVIGLGAVVGEEARVIGSEIEQLSEIGPRAEIIASKIGEEAVIGFGAQIRHSQIGPKNKIEATCFLDGVATKARVEIGDHVDIREGSMIGYESKVGSSTLIDEGVIVSDHVLIEGMVHIGKRVIIGEKSRILEGTNLKSGRFFAKRIKAGEVVYPRELFKRAIKGDRYF
jgi:UDP-3-O-[3-hydroxymyristoyl] glucosamine N-acyltransferase